MLAPTVGGLRSGQVSGQVKSLKVKPGDRVTKGQPIADIDDVPQRNDLRNAEAALNVVKADLQAKQALLKQAELRFKRQRQMLNEEASSRENFESAEATLATTRAELLSLNARLVQAQIEVDKKKVDLSYTRVVAPMDGIVIAAVTQQGQTVNSSQSAPTIIKLARLDVMTIKAQISEADITRIYIGQNAAQLSPHELARIRREYIGFIFQRYHLMPDLSALGNVEIPAIYANSERDQRRLRAAALLGRLGLEGREHHKPGELSGGQQQAGHRRGSVRCTANLALRGQ
ncbi:HlyD family secretion protein [Yersinia pekkanenii]|uniref:HlyD family secretion protein n=1 Tax=Yersinia pekkanenii TaxID=1288385 RepID=A0A0T9RGM1_9GAMM|nr:HlyD family secretion protein [Yersinia pekkanenii]CRY69476.1 HlyD family secretion protein [Yersinia pekkanenii]